LVWKKSVVNVGGPSQKKVELNIVKYPKYRNQYRFPVGFPYDLFRWSISFWLGSLVLHFLGQCVHFCPIYSGRCASEVQVDSIAHSYLLTDQLNGSVQDTYLAKSTERRWNGFSNSCVPSCQGSCIGAIDEIADAPSYVFFLNLRNSTTHEHFLNAKKTASTQQFSLVRHSQKEFGLQDLVYKKNASKNDATTWCRAT
jgi:hypothetical protein